VSAKQKGVEAYLQDPYYTEPLNLKDEQKQRLLDNSERVERTGQQLRAGYRVLLETEEIGASVLRDLNVQRETIEKSRNRVSGVFSIWDPSPHSIFQSINLTYFDSFYCVAGRFARQAPS